MADFTVRADSVNVEQVMDQIRARIREKRGVDYNEQQIREIATAKLERFLDPRGVRSDLLERFRSAQPVYTPPDLPNFAFEGETLFESHRGPLRTIRRLLLPILKLFFNPGPLIQALNIQSKLNRLNAEREARREAARHGMDQLYYEVMHNLVVETTRMAIEVKNLKMKVESLTSRLEFNERRARALESVVVYKPLDGSSLADLAPPPASELDPAAAAEPSVPGATPPVPDEGPGQRSRRRRRRRGRRGATPAATLLGGPGDAVDRAGDEPLDDEGGEPEGADADAAPSDRALPLDPLPAAQPTASSPEPAAAPPDRPTPDADGQ